MIAAAFSNFMGSVYVVTKKSTASLWISLAGAAANIALDLLLIPRIGVQGAARGAGRSCRQSLSLHIRKSALRQSAATVERKYPITPQQNTVRKSTLSAI